jgi:hypothetical protein
MWRLIAAHRKQAGRDANFERGKMKSRSIEVTNTSRWFAARRRALAVKYFAETELRDAELKLATLEQAWPRSRGASDLLNNAGKNGGQAHDVMRVAE